MVTAYLENTSVGQVALRTSSISESTSEHGVTLSYDDVIDDLHIYLEPRPIRRHVDPVNSYLSMLVDSDTDIPFDIMVDSFLTHTVHEIPRLRPIADYLQLGERPYRDPNLYRTDAPPRTSFPDYAWSDAAHDAIENIGKITGGIVKE